MGQGRQPFGGLETAKMHGCLLLSSKKFVEKVKAAKTAKFFGALQGTASFFPSKESFLMRLVSCLMRIFIILLLFV